MRSAHDDWRSRHDRHDDDIIPLDDRIDSTHR